MESISSGERVEDLVVLTLQELYGIMSNSLRGYQYSRDEVITRLENYILTDGDKSTLTRELASSNRVELELISKLPSLNLIVSNIMQRSGMSLFQLCNGGFYLYEAVIITFNKYGLDKKIQ